VSCLTYVIGTKSFVRWGEVCRWKWSAHLSPYTNTPLEEIAVTHSGHFLVSTRKVKQYLIVDSGPLTWSLWFNSQFGQNFVFRNTLVSFFFFMSPRPSNCQQWCRYPSGALSGVVQVPLRCPVRSGAEVGLLSLRLSVSQGASLGDFLLAPACSIEKVTLWEGFLYLTPGSETGEGIAKDKVSGEYGNWARDSGSKAQYAIY